MLVAVKMPHIEISMHGDIPQHYIELLKTDFGENVSIDPENNDEEYIDIFNTEWYKNETSKRTPGGTLRFYRKLHKLSQSDLAGRLGIAPQTVSNMETGVRPISRVTAYKLAEIFDIPAGRFI